MLENEEGGLSDTDCYQYLQKFLYEKERLGKEIMQVEMFSDDLNQIVNKQKSQMMMTKYSKYSNMNKYLEVTLPQSINLKEIEESNKYILVDKLLAETERHFTCPPQAFAVFAHDQDVDYGRFASDKSNKYEKQKNIVNLIDDAVS